jgi:hypothetical protein
MRVYVTGRGLRCQKRIYEKVAGLSRYEAQHFKRRGVIDVSREVGEILIRKGWASDDINHPLLVRKGAAVLDQPMPVHTSELEVERTAETQDKPLDFESEEVSERSEPEKSVENEESPDMDSGESNEKGDA